MKHFNKLLFFFLIAPFFSLAQANYQPGLVVTLNGDTVRGFIDFRDWDSNPTTIYFKSSVTDKDRKTYNIHTISFFNITGLAAYKKYVCSISTDITNTARIGEGRDTSFRIDTVFLQVLQTGKNVALYSYADDLKTRFYIGDAPNYAPTELISRVYYDPAKAGVTVNENTYQKQLFTLANKYNAIDDKSARLFQSPRYNKDDLLAIISRINNISKAEFDQKYASHSRINFYAGVALNIASTSSSSVTPYSEGGGGSYTSFLPAFAVGFNLIPSTISDKVELKLDVTVATAQFKSLYKLTVSPYAEAKASYDQLNVSISPQIIYNFYHAPDLNVFAGAGYVLTDLNFSSPYFGNQAGGNSTTNFPNESYSFNKTAGTFLLKAGVKLHKNWEVYFNYITSASITQSGYFSFYEASEQVGVNYLFGR